MSASPNKELKRSGKKDCLIIVSTKMGRFRKALINVCICIYLNDNRPLLVMMLIRRYSPGTHTLGTGLLKHGYFKYKGIKTSTAFLILLVLMHAEITLHKLLGPRGQKKDPHVLFLLPLCCV